VKVGDKPLTGGGVSFVPDPSKGNEAHATCIGRLGPEGQFEIKTSAVRASDSGNGAPLGWYKVIFISMRGSPDIKVNPIYLDAATTPLAVEVVADPKPGHYEFQISK